MAGSVNQCRVTADPNGKNLDYVISAAGWVDAVVLVSNVGATYTVPTDVDFVVFSASVDVYANFAASNAAVPTSSVDDGTASVLVKADRGAARRVAPAQEIGLIAAAGSGGIVTIEAYTH